MAEHYPHVDVTHPTEDDINSHFDQLIECVNRRRVELIIELREKLSERRAAATSRTQMMQQLMDSKSDLQNRMKENLLHSMRERMLEEMDRKLRDLQVVEREVNVMFECDMKELEEKISVLGELIEREIISTPNYPALLQPDISVCKEGTADGQLYWPNGVAYDDKSNLIYVVDTGNIKPSNISVFSMKGEFIDRLCEGIIKGGYGIAISGNIVFVTDIELDCVFKFKFPEFKLLTRVGKLGKGLRQFNNPCHLTVSSSGSVFVADCSNNRVVVLSTGLIHKQFITHESMTQPYDVKVHNNRVYILSWKDNPCLHMFNLSGDKIGSIITCNESGGAQVMQCYSFCFDKQLNIIIGDFTAGNMKVFSQEGELLHTLGDTQEKNKTIKLTDITITDNNRIICVSSNTEFRLHIF